MSVARQAIWWQWGAVVYTIVAALFFAFMPLFAQPNGAFVSAYRMLGIGVFGPLLLPLALTVIPPLNRWRRLQVSWVCTALLALICLFLAFSWGIVFLPAPMIAAVGAYLLGRAPIEDEEVVDAPWKVPKT